MPIDLVRLRKAAEAALAEHPGVRTQEPHPFRPATEAVLLTEGNGIAEGDKAQIALMAAADPQTILVLIRAVETAKAHRAACKAILATEKTAELIRAMKAMADTRDALDAALAALETTDAT